VGAARGAALLFGIVGTHIYQTVSSARAAQHSTAGCSVMEVLSSQTNLVVKGRSSLQSAQLREYQWAGVSWLTQLRRFDLNGILADEMGLGKTI